MVARAEQMVDLLGGDGWKLDAERAAQFIESVRTFDDIGLDCPKFKIVRNWMRDHGQSLDWLLYGDVTWLLSERQGVGNPVDADLIALGEILKPALEKYAALNSEVDRLHQEALDASKHMGYLERLGNPTARARFEATAAQNGYNAASKMWNAADQRFIASRRLSSSCHQTAASAMECEQRRHWRLTTTLKTPTRPKKFCGKWPLAQVSRRRLR
jgi:hypothetical protein